MAELARSCSASLRRSARLAFLDARLVAEAVEQVPAQPDRDQPVGAAPVVEALPVRLESGVSAYLRQKIAVRGGRLVFGQTDGQLHLAGFRSLARALLFVVREQAFRQVARAPARWSERARCRAAGPAHRSAPRAPRPDRPRGGSVAREHRPGERGSTAHRHRWTFRRSGRIGRDPRSACGRTHGLVGCIQLLRAQQGVVIRADHAGDHFHLGAPALLAGHVFGQFGRAHRVPGLTCVVERLIGGDLRLEVVEEIGPVQRSKSGSSVRRTGAASAKKRTQRPDCRYASTIRNS